MELVGIFLIVLLWGYIFDKYGVSLGKQLGLSLLFSFAIGFYMAYVLFKDIPDNFDHSRISSMGYALFGDIPHDLEHSLIFSFGMYLVFLVLWGLSNFQGSLTDSLTDYLLKKFVKRE